MHADHHGGLYRLLEWRARRGCGPAAAVRGAGALQRRGEGGRGWGLGRRLAGLVALGQGMARMHTVGMNGRRRSGMGQRAGLGAGPSAGGDSGGEICTACLTYHYVVGTG
jgi:hypothetical protein